MSIPHLEDVIPHAERVLRDHNDTWPWIVVGVFGTSEDLTEHGDYSDFCYSNGAATGPYNAEYWCSAFSIEGRYGGPHIISATLNIIIGAVHESVLGPGDSLLVPLGIPDENGDWVRDADSVFWIGEPVDDVDNFYQTNMTPIDRIIPIKWSSPLGWDDE